MGLLHTRAAISQQLHPYPLHSSSSPKREVIADGERRFAFRRWLPRSLPPSTQDYPTLPMTSTGIVAAKSSMRSNRPRRSRPSRSPSTRAATSSSISCSTSGVSAPSASESTCHPDTDALDRARARPRRATHTDAAPSANTSTHPHASAANGHHAHLRDNEPHQRSLQLAESSPSR